MKKNSIPLVRAAFKEPFRIAMLNNGISPEYFFAKVNLPNHEQENPESLLPLKPFWRLLSIVAVEGGVSDYGAQVAQITPWHEIDSMVPLLKRCTDLEDLLHTFSQILPSQDSIVRFALQKSRGETWFTRFGPIAMESNIQLELYDVTGMTQLVQIAAGSDWLPDQVNLIMAKNSTAKNSWLIGRCHLNFSMDRTAIRIPNTVLKLPVNLNKQPTSEEKRAKEIEFDFVSNVSDIIRTYVSDVNFSLAKLSDISQISERTLQRRLKKSGTSFSKLLRSVRSVKARELVGNSALTLIEISSQLGYTDPAHFSHAFRRWTGMTPSNFRNRVNDKE